MFMKRPYQRYDHFNILYMYVLVFNVVFKFLMIILYLYAGSDREISTQLYKQLNQIDYKYKIRNSDQT